MAETCMTFLRIENYPPRSSGGHSHAFRQMHVNDNSTPRKWGLFGPQIDSLLSGFLQEATLVGGSENYSANGSPLGEYVPGDPAQSAINMENALERAIRGWA